MVQLGHHEVYGFLACLDIPDTVACEQDELRPCVNRFDANVREGRHGLVSWLELVVAFIFEVTKGA